ncbi:MAG: ABC transporter ATP-binding protein [Caldilineaceae bacterium]
MPYVIRRLLQLQGAVHRAHYHARVFGIFTCGLTHLLATARLLALGMGIWLFFQGQVTIGALFLIVYYVSLLQEPLEKLRTEIEALQQATASIDRISALLAEPEMGGGQPQLATGNATLSSDGGTGGVAVTFADVDFHYAAPLPAVSAPNTNGAADESAPQSTQPMVLQDISFHLPAGEVLGLLGRTGSGKTTLTRLLFQLYQPQRGEIRIGAHSLAALDLSTLRRHIGMVTQEVQLFQATLRDNLTFFDPTVNDTKIIDVIHELGLATWFAAQPQGLDTVLTGGGSGLSAGEAQLLAFVRVFLKDPQLVILDEASSRLDPATEQLLERAIDRLLADRTGIIIAHRLATVQRADHILILEQGRIAEFGERIVLSADPSSRFAGLLAHGQANQALQEVLA